LARFGARPHELLLLPPLPPLLPLPPLPLPLPPLLLVAVATGPWGAETRGMELVLSSAEQQPPGGSEGGPSVKRQREEEEEEERPPSAQQSSVNAPAGTPAGTPPGGPPAALDPTAQPQPLSSLAARLAAAPNPYALPRLSGNLDQREGEQMVLEALQAKIRSQQLTHRWLQEEAAQSGKPDAFHTGGGAGWTHGVGFIPAMQQHQALALAQLQQGINYMMQDYCHLKQEPQPQPQPQPRHVVQSRPHHHVGAAPVQPAHPHPAHLIQQMPDALLTSPRPLKPAKKRPRKTSRQPTRDPAIMAARPTLDTGYDPDELTWYRTNLFTKKRSRNLENIYCYCAQHLPDEPCVQCFTCGNWFHIKCCDHPQLKDSAQFLPFQLNYKFCCKCCNYPSWTEYFRLAKSSWIEAVLSAQSHLMWKTQRDIFRVAEVADFVERHWHLLCVDEVRDPAAPNLSAHKHEELGPTSAATGVTLVEKDKKEGKWRDSFNSYWTTHEHRYFTRPERGYWGIKTHKQLQAAAQAQADSGEGAQADSGSGSTQNVAAYTAAQSEDEEQWGPAMQPCRIFRAPMTKEARRRALAAQDMGSDEGEFCRSASGGVSPRARSRGGAATSPRNASPRNRNGNGNGKHAARQAGKRSASHGGNGGLPNSGATAKSRPSLHEMAERDRELYSKPEAPTFRHSGSSGSRPSSSRRRNMQSSAAANTGTSQSHENNGTSRDRSRGQTQTKNKAKGNGAAKKERKTSSGSMRWAERVDDEYKNEDQESYDDDDSSGANDEYDDDHDIDDYDEDVGSHVDSIPRGASCHDASLASCPLVAFGSS
jgi:hypothetical protein